MAADSGHLYWADFNAGAIGRANLDASGVDQRFITGANAPPGMAVSGAYVY